MKIICIAGLIGSGKDVVAKYIEDRYGYFLIDYATKLRELCRKEGMEVTRDNLQMLRLKYGNTFLAEAVVEEIKKSSSTKIILSPMRRSEDFLIPKKEFPECKLIVIAASDVIRYERLRARERENDPKTIEEFRRQESREFEIFDLNKTFSYADYVIENEGTMETLKNRVDKLMQEIEK
jgi:dephospho-CoA kinase